MLLLSLIAGVAHGAWAQSSCSSDGQATPLALVERFISADCEACWRAPQTSTPSARALSLDWIVPSAQGEAAPLAAAASPDARLRLETLGHAAPTESFVTSSKLVAGRAATLRVAHGVPVGGYIGASIELKTTPRAFQPGPLSVWLALVETLPAGTEGSPYARNLVRNVLLPSWNKPDVLSKTEQVVFRETRALSIPAGASYARLRVVGWVQDAHGRVRTAARSVCAPPA